MKNRQLRHISVHYESEVVAEKVILASDFWTRFCGYMFRRKPHVPGILFEPAGAIQTTFMKFNLDVIYLSKQNEIVKVVREMKPWRHTWSNSKAKKVLELPAGLLPCQAKEGDFIKIIEAY